MVVLDRDWMVMFKPAVNISHCQSPRCWLSCRSPAYPMYCLSTVDSCVCGREFATVELAPSVNCL